MKRFVLRLAFALSILFNIAILLVVLLSSLPDKDNLENPQYRTTTAQNLMRSITVKNLYFPESYDPVYTVVDSAFYGPLTDRECLKAATELIELKSELPSAENRFKEATHQLRIFGSFGVFWRHAEDKKNAEEYLNNLKTAITKREEIIRQRDSSRDGEYIGWKVRHRFRATTNEDVFMIDEMYIVNPEITNYIFRYSLNKSDLTNLYALEKVISQTLGQYKDN